MQTVVRPTANSVMKPVSTRLTPRDSASAALTAMTETDSGFVTVVAADTGELLGIVLRRALEFGCDRMGHDMSRCPLSNHLKLDVQCCGSDEPLPEARSNGRRASPLIVVDAQRVPVGFIE